MMNELDWGRGCGGALPGLALAFALEFVEVFGEVLKNSNLTINDQTHCTSLHFDSTGLWSLSLYPSSRNISIYHSLKILSSILP